MIWHSSGADQVVPTMTLYAPIPAIGGFRKGAEDPAGTQDTPSSRRQLSSVNGVKLVQVEF